MMGGGFGFGIPGVGMVLIWGLIILAVILLVRAFTGAEKTPGGSAREILDERFARGEINEEEYQRKRKALH